MRTTSNPAFRNLPQGQGYASFGPSAGAAERPITIDDVVLKTGLSIATALVTGVLTVLSGLYALALPAFLVGFVLSLVLIFKPQWAKAPLVLAYSAVEGVALGGITGVFENFYHGIAVQAVVGTAGVFLGMLVVYKTGAVRVTPRFTRWLMGALVGVVVLMLFDFVLGMFGVTTGLREGGPLGIVFSIVIIGVAAFSLLLDFDQADRAIRSGAPAGFAWYVAFGLMTTLVWLYIEILRLLSFLRQN